VLAFFIGSGVESRSRVVRGLDNSFSQSASREVGGRLDGRLTPRRLCRFHPLSAPSYASDAVRIAPECGSASDGPI